MPTPAARRPRWLARLSALLSVRTISGKLIIGLVVLFGVASVAVSLVTAQSLRSSLMSALDGQLQAATNTWSSCVHMVYSDGYAPGGGGPDADQQQQDPGYQPRAERPARQPACPRALSASLAPVGHQLAGFST